MNMADWYSKLLHALLPWQFPSAPIQNYRSFSLNLDDKSALANTQNGYPYISNSIRTSRCTVWDFLPRQLFYQFSRLANFYFLVIAILQAIPGFSTTGSFTTLIPLVIFLVIIISKEGYDDWKRYRLDRIENARPVTVLRHSSVCTRRPRSYGWGLKEHPPLTDSPHTEEIEGMGESNYRWTKTTWEDLKVGEVVMLSRDENIPADIVLLHATGEGGVAYIETMDLDGETNLKTRHPPIGLGRCDTIESIATCPIDFRVENPNADLYRFDGSVIFGGKTIPLTPTEVAYRGCILRNTTTVIGIITNTGEDCKVRQNANRKATAKRPALESVINQIIVVLILYVVLVSTFCSVNYIFWGRSVESTSWYLANAQIPFQQIYIAFIIMFNNVIPLSLYVGLEAIKIGQMSLIANDLEIYHEETDTPAKCNTTNNIDDLGQIKYVFTDKTGTLTENIMKLRKLSISGVSWFHPDQENQCSTPSQSMTNVCPPNSSPRQDDLDLTTFRLLEYIQREPESPLASTAKRYILALAVCHTCLPEICDDGETDYQASSPDELALVRGAREMGFFVIQRSSSSITVQTSDVDGVLHSQVYQILDVIDFNSTRKRMTIIVQCPDGRLWLISKGADSVIIPRLRVTLNHQGETRTGSLGSDQYRKNFDRLQTQSIQEMARGGSVPGVQQRREVEDRWTHTSRLRQGSFEEFELQPAHNGQTIYPPSQAQSGNFDTLEDLATLDTTEALRRCSTHIDHYATEGLRTLVYADRELSEQDYLTWKALYHEAETSLVDRQLRIEEVSDLIEHSLDLVGAAAIEDKLQKGVPETIQQLRQANIKIWMLTGDKRETAISIAHSTKICSSESAIFVLDVTSGDLESQLLNTMEAVRSRPPGTAYPGHGAHVVVVVDGETLTAIEQSSGDAARDRFHSLMPLVDSVICCRASPSQKALLVGIIREGRGSSSSSVFSKMSRLWTNSKKPLTLAIGDGANDIAMITSANVGVGISGHEGQQAARSADFSISQFRFLSRLLLVHGRWSYYRTTRFILVTFWKEVFFYFPAALYQHMAGGTGTSLYDSTSLLVVSFFTAACIVVIGTWDRDLQARTLLAVPELYVYGQNGDGLTLSMYTGWMINALVTGFIVFVGCWLGYGSSETIDDNGLYALGALVFSVCLIWINCKILILEIHHKTIIPLCCFLVTITALWCFNIVAPMASSPTPSPYAMRDGLISRFGRDPAWWITLIVVLTILTSFEVGLKAVEQNPAVRALLARSSSKKGIMTDGVRDGFWPWEPRLWQESEKDPAVIEILESKTSTRDFGISR